MGIGRVTGGIPSQGYFSLQGFGWTVSGKDFYKARGAMKRWRENLCVLGA